MYTILEGLEREKHNEVSLEGWKTVKARCSDREAGVLLMSQAANK